MKQTQMYVCTLLEFIVIDVASLLYKVELIGWEIVLVFMQSQLKGPCSSFPFMAIKIVTKNTLRLYVKS